jgi:ribA/ribD-fused uncharacterized protein
MSKIRWGDVEAPADAPQPRANGRGRDRQPRRPNGGRGPRGHPNPHRQGQGPIRFFGKKSKYAIFSNFAETPITIGGLDYSTVEHYFQSMKFTETAPEYADEIRLSPTPLDAKRLGKSRDYPIDADWADSKRGQGNSVTVMRRALLYKALQNEEFRRTLLSTRDDQYIIEASPYDSYWGEGRSKKGKNMLGRLLVELRFILRAKGDVMYGGGTADEEEDQDNPGDEVDVDEE